MRKLLIGLIVVCLSALPTVSTSAENVHKHKKHIVKKQVVKHKPIPSKDVQVIKLAQFKHSKEGKYIFAKVDKYSSKYNVDKQLVHAVIMAESNYNTKATSSCGAQGLMQVMPRGSYNLYNADTNIMVGTRHLAGLLAKYKGNEALALAAYNMGGGAVDRNRGRVPHAAKRYIKQVQKNKKIIDHLI